MRKASQAERHARSPEGCGECRIGRSAGWRKVLDGRLGGGKWGEGTKPRNGCNEGAVSQSVW